METDRRSRPIRDGASFAMTQPLNRPDRFFFGTRVLPCPYIRGRQERKLVTELDGPHAAALYERMSRAGFRRSHGLAYRPACPQCAACVPIRICVRGFQATRSISRIMRLNADLAAEELGAVATMEQYRLFARYQRARHGGGEMSRMSFNDYRAMVEDTPVDTRMIELRHTDGALVGAMMADRLSDSLSAVYSFFAPELGRRSLGTYLVLRMVEDARAHGLDHVYLGYWIAESAKMAYKIRFRPVEILGPDGWVAYRHAERGAA